MLTGFQEDGVYTAIQSIYRDMEYAKTLIRKKDGKIDDPTEDSEESWTFIGDDNDPELVRRIHDWETGAFTGKQSQALGTSVLGSGSGISPSRSGV